MGEKETHLIHCAANQLEASIIANNLSSSGIVVQSINSSDFSNSAAFAQAIVQAEGHGLLLVSDNFLKSDICLEDTMQLLQERIEAGNVLPVIADGHYPQEDGSDNLVTTKISRMGHIMKYMSYWQDVYLKARRELRLTAPDERADKEASVATIKEISISVSDFLTYLKDEDCISYEEFQAQKGAAFFQRIGNLAPEQWLASTVSTAVLANQVVEERDSFVPGHAIADTVTSDDNYTETEVPSSTTPTIDQPTFETNTSTATEPSPTDQIVSTEPQIPSSATEVEDPIADNVEETVENISVDEAASTYSESDPILESEIRDVELEVATNPSNEAALIASSPTLPQIEEKPVTINPVSEPDIVNIAAETVIVEPTPATTLAEDTPLESIPLHAEPVITSRESFNQVAAAPIGGTVPAQSEKKLSANTPLLPLQADDKVVLIMGVTTPIGQAIADIFSENGYRIILTGNRFSQLFKMRLDLQERFQKEVRLLPFDPNVAVSMDMVMEDLDVEWQQIDLLINVSDFSDLSAIGENWTQLLHINLNALYNLSEKIIPYVARQQEGQIINIAAIDASPAKEAIRHTLQNAIEAFTKTIRLDLENSDVKVSQLYPQVAAPLQANTTASIANIIYVMVTQSGPVDVTKVYLTSS